MSGTFITIEGIDGAGKTTQTHLLVGWLIGLGYEVCATREPGGTSAGERIRQLVLSREWPIAAEAELFLYLADRAIHVSHLIRRALAAGDVVVCERYSDSTLAYQGYGRGLDLGLLRRLNGIATGGLVPDLTLVLDVPVDMARLDGGRLDRLESEGREFLARVAGGFREIAREEPGRVKVVDGSGGIGAVHEAIAAEVQGLLARV
jgi:dTMP kinase